VVASPPWSHGLHSRIGHHPHIPRLLSSSPPALPPAVLVTILRSRCRQASIYPPSPPPPLLSSRRMVSSASSGFATLGGAVSGPAGNVRSKAAGQEIGERGRVGRGLHAWRAHPTASVPCLMPPIPLSFGPGSSEWTGRLRSLLEGKHSRGSKGDGCFWMVGRRERGGEGGQDEGKEGKDEALTRKSH
jgi:hypothetical protein